MRLRNITVAALTLGFCALAAAVLLYRLGDFPLKDWDEAIYAEVIREMIRTGDILTPHYNHAPYFNKPPLYFWLGQFAVRALGFSEWSSRLPGVAFGALTLAATAGFGRALGGPACGLWSAAALLSCSMFLENGSRHATPDSLLLLLSVAALWAQWKGRRAPAWRFAAAACLGLAVLAKGAAAAPLGGTLLLAHLLAGDGRRWSLRAYLAAAAIAAAIVAPWYAAQTALHGRTFWTRHAYWSVWQRATQSGVIAASHEREISFYLNFLAQHLRYLWPAAVLLVWLLTERARAGGIRAIASAWTSRREAGLTLLAAALTPLALFSAARNKAWWYILPAVPPVCIGCGLTISAAVRRLWTTPWRKAVLAALMAALAVSMTVNARSTLQGQIRNGVAAFGPLADLAKAADAFADRVGMTRPVLVFPRESPTVAVYVRFPVLVEPDYAAKVRAGGLSALPNDGVFVIDRAAAVEELGQFAAVTTIARRKGLALALLQPQQPAAPAL